MTDFLDAWALESDEHARLLAEERLITEVTEALWEAMQRAAVSKSELASRLGKSKGHVSQLFSGSRNMTLRTLANISAALDCDVSVSISRRCEGEVVSRDAGVRHKSRRMIGTMLDV
jgi:transcriptional regulator with XRE-family HTH domain